MIVVHAGSGARLMINHYFTYISDGRRCCLVVYAMRQAGTGHMGAVIALGTRISMLYETYLVDVTHVFARKLWGSFDRRYTQSRKGCRCRSLSSLRSACCVPNDHRVDRDLQVLQESVMARRHGLMLRSNASISWEWEKRRSHQSQVVIL
jgi:hypothetical protein